MNGNQMTGTWGFKEYTPSDTLRQPVSGDFFSSDAIAGVAAALVRESIQNSLDAGNDAGRRVRVVFQLGKAAAAKVGPIFRGLWPHIHAEGNGLSDQPHPDEDCPYVTVEDFGTSGLIGDPEQWHPISGHRNDFYAFFRAEGYTNKEGADRGRWGVGKTVFPRSSRINGFLGLTVPRHGHPPSLLGRCILKAHEVGDTPYLPDGYWGLPQTDGFCAPLLGERELQEIRRTFGLRRTDEPGLSVVVPWRDPEITESALLAAVLSDYFFPIIAGHLSVEIFSTRQSWSLNRSSFETVLDEVQQRADLDDVLAKLLEDREPLFRLASLIHGEEPRLIEIDRPDPSGAPKWSPEMVANVRDRIRSSLRENLYTGIRVPLRVQRKGGGPLGSHFDIFLARTERDGSTRPTFVREGIVITEAHGDTVSRFTAIVNVEEGPLATLLGDAENVAHTQWTAAGSNFRDKYRYGKSYLRFVKESVARVLSLVFEGEVDEDPELLLDFFSIVMPEQSEEEEDTERPRPRPSKEGEVEPSPPPPPPRPARYRLYRVEGGFGVRTGDPEGEQPESIVVRLGYDTRSGDPVKGWDPADFDLADADFDIETQGVEIARRSGNHLHLRVLEPEFRAVVRGFDRNRDLFVRAQAIGITEAGGDR